LKKLKNEKKSLNKNHERGRSIGRHAPTLSPSPEATAAGESFSASVRLAEYLRQRLRLPANGATR